MTEAYVKKIIQIGGSLAIILPSQWAKRKVKAGEEMVVVGNGELRIIPLHQKENQQDGEDKDEIGQTHH